MYCIDDIRSLMASKYETGDFVIDKSGQKTVELMGCSFKADQDSIFGKVNEDYIKRELDWYNSMSLNVNDIPEPVPAIWKSVASSGGLINSNYGWAIYSQENGSQYDNVVHQIKSSRDTRRASMIYTRPTMHKDYNKDGMSDFMCTHAVNYLIRDSKINAVVQMRSNDAWAGYRNDYAWQLHVLKMLSDDTGYELGDIIWNSASLHIYERQFYLLDYYLKTGKIDITKEEYNKLGY